MNAKDMSTDDIKRRIGDVTIEIAKIKAQIENARLIAAETGERVDPKWLYRAKLALSFKGREHQDLNIEFGRRRSEERRAYNARVERAFVDAARWKLDATTFRLLFDEALAKLKKR